MATQTISLTELRPRLSELIERARSEFERFFITRRGRAEAVLLSADDFEGLLETIEILSDQAQVKRLAEAGEELAASGGHSLQELREALGRGGS